MIDFDLIDDSKCISAIYKSDVPDFENVKVIKASIKPGADMNLLLVIDIKELPICMPAKWLKQAVNTIQIEILFLCVEFKKIVHITDSNYTLSIQSFDNVEKLVSLKSRTDGSMVIFNTKWIYFKSIKAYLED